MGAILLSSAKVSRNRLCMEDKRKWGDSGMVQYLECLRLSGERQKVRCDGTPGVLSAQQEAIPSELEAKRGLWMLYSRISSETDMSGTSSWKVWVKDLEVPVVRCIRPQKPRNVIGLISPGQNLLDFWSWVQVL